MPHLSSLEVVSFVRLVEGFPSYFLEAMIRAPQLRTIHVENHHHWPMSVGDLPDDIPQFLPHMQTFIWTRFLWRAVNEGYLYEESAFFLSFLPRMRPTLRILHLTAESLCYRELTSSPWPSLVELSITGQRPLVPINPGMDFSALLTNIPSLQSFSLLMPQSAETSRFCLLRPSNNGPLHVLDSLQSLSISFPSPEDAILDCLPQSMRHLSLTDWPRHYFRVDENPCVFRRGWTSPILTSAELLDIIRRCHLPGLESLEVVYEAESSDNDVLLDIALQFPALRTLKIFRYRASSSDPVDQVSLIIFSLDFCSRAF